MLNFTSVGVENRLPKDYVVDVVRRYGLNYDHQLIYRNLHNTMNTHCSNKSLDEIFLTEFANIGNSMRQRLQSQLETAGVGLVIHRVFVSKPVIPQSLQDEYDWADLLRRRILTTEQEKIYVVERERVKRTGMELQMATKKERAQLEAECQMIEATAERDASLMGLEVERARVSKPDYLTRETLQAMGQSGPVLLHMAPAQAGLLHGAGAVDPRSVVQWVRSWYSGDPGDREGPKNERE